MEREKKRNKMKIVDMHCDTIARLYERKEQGEKETLNRNQLDIDLQKLELGDYLLQNFAVFLDLEKSPHPYQKAVNMIQLFKDELAVNAERISLVTNYEQMKQNEQDGKLSALLTLEEGEICEGDLKKLDALYQMGARMLTLTWNYENSLGHPNVNAREKKEDSIEKFTTPEVEKGLTKRGIEFVERMNEIGMIVDVSHLSDAGFYDVARYSTKPFVASHSNARQVCPWVRNLTDNMIRTLSNCGGVMGLNFCMNFLKSSSDSENGEDYMDAVVAHAKHIVNIGGMDVLGFGTDFDGIERNVDLQDASYMPKLIHKMKKAGFTGDNLDKIMKDNVLRVYREVLV